MGFISQLAKSEHSVITESVLRGRNHWREVFGIDKESGGDRPAVRKPQDGGSWGRGVLGGPEGGPAFKRLLQAMRSMAPGGWSDDRWEQTKHWSGITYAAGHRKAELLAQSEFQVFERDDNSPDGKRPVRRNEEGYKLIKLLEKPNREDSFGDLLYRWDQQMTLTGKALTWMVPNRLQVPMELYSIPTAIAIPQPAINPDFPDGFYRIQPIYPYGPFSSYPTPASAVGAPIPAQWMMDFKFPHPLLRYDGFSPLTALRLHLDEIEGIDKSRWYSMKRGIRPDAVLNFDEVEGMEQLPDAEIERIKAEFENDFAGPENVGRLFVAARGSKLEPFGQRPVDMDYQTGWSQLVDFALASLGITKPAAGMVEDSSYSTLFATLKQFYWLTLDPTVSRISSKLTRHLAPFFGDNLIVEVRCKRIDDHEVNFTKVDKLSTLKGLPASVIRVALKLLDIPPDEKMITDLEKAGQQEQGGMGGTPGQSAPQEEQAQDPTDMLDELVSEDENEEQRDDPGSLGEGSLGPRMKSLDPFKKLERSNWHKKRFGFKGPYKRKTLSNIQTKSLYDQMMEVVGNGHH